LQKPWIARKLQGFCKSRFWRAKHIKDLTSAKICKCKFLFGGIREYQGVAGEKIWKIEFLSGSPPDPPANPILRPLRFSSRVGSIALTGCGAKAGMSRKCFSKTEPAARGFHRRAAAKGPA
jgi:hypothetical protein